MNTKALITLEYDKIINLPVNDERVIKYLKGETIEAGDFCFFDHGKGTL